MRCVRGAIDDVTVDLRPESATFMDWVGVELTAENRRALYLPRGCAHGYQTLMDDTEILYPVSALDAPGAERGVLFDDPAFGIEWPITPPPVLSDTRISAGRTTRPPRRVRPPRPPSRVDGMGTPPVGGSTPRRGPLPWPPTPDHCPRRSSDMTVSPVCPPPQAR